jgi:hypothetical protein
VAGIYVGAGFNSMGIASAGGAGKALAEWIVEGAPTMRSLAGRHPALRRLQQQPGAGCRTASRRRLACTTRCPGRTANSTRPGPSAARRSMTGWPPRAPVFGSKMGWERANWFAAESGEKRSIRYSFGRQNWHETVAAEHEAPAREAAGIFDHDQFRQASCCRAATRKSALQRICRRRCRRASRHARSTPACSMSAAPIESDLTAARIARQAILLLTGTAQATRMMPTGSGKPHPRGRVALTDVTSSYAVLALMPAARPATSCAASRRPTCRPCRFPGQCDPRDRRSAMPRPTPTA